MKTTIEIDTEDTYETCNAINIIANYLDKKKIKFVVIGYTKCANCSQFSVVTADGMRE